MRLVKCRRDKLLIFKLVKQERSLHWQTRLSLPLQQGIHVGWDDLNKFYTKYGPFLVLPIIDHRICSNTSLITQEIQERT
jgi:hypothetical protein